MGLERAKQVCRGFPGAGRWVLVASPDALDDDEMATLLQRSYSLIVAGLTKKMQRDIGESAT